MRLAPAVSWIPGLMAAVYAVMQRSVRLRQATGTLSVTAVGMFAGGGGHGIGPATILPGVLVGGASPRSRVVGGRIEVRDVLDLTITLDHRVVDGAPAARFGAELRRLLESPELVLRPRAAEVPQA
ncbi:MAG TPA: 2-oxo acid dehydrogenase subunit E2 [Actinomycetota bacterium]|nr:2-oxo acid dehydrogenase subunit E2 [Actinomycetota bacterium]